MSYLFFATPGAMETRMSAGEEYTVSLWRPGWLRPVPPGHTAPKFWIWAAFHLLRIFGNRDYAVLMIHSGSGLVHRSCLFPPYFRFPFMNADDLQIGDTWTDPAHRGRGLATFALRYLTGTEFRPGRTFWYVVDEDNAASTHVVEKAGFERIGRGDKRQRLGLKLLGAYVILRARHSAEESIISN